MNLADGHFCALNTGLYHIDTSQWCVNALFFKNNNKIDTYCRLALSNITGPQANYLDQGLWAISVETPVLMEVKCNDHSHVKALEPPSLSPTCNQHAVHPLLSLNFCSTLKGIFFRLPCHIEVCKPPYSKI